MDVAHRVEATPPGFRLLDEPRKNRVGGGTALIFREHFHVTKIAGGEVDSFEYSEWSVVINSYRLRLVIIYRPPYSSNHPITINRFFIDFPEYLESIVLCPEPILITGDFNIHVDVSDDPNTNRCLDLLESMGLQQHVYQPTHEMGHILDLIITRKSDTVLDSPPTPHHLFSDHLSVLCNLKQKNTSFPVKEVVYRDVKHVNIDSLKHDLYSSMICVDTPEGLEELTECYKTSLADTFNTHAPLKFKKVTIRPRLPWFNNEIKSAIRLRRVAERKWRRTNNACDLLNYKIHRNKVTSIMNKARCEFYKEFINTNSSNQRKLFRATKRLLRQSNDVPFPPFNDKLTFANNMGSFFVKK